MTCTRMTHVIEAPRVSLLRCLAWMRDFEARNPDLVDEYWPTHTPLFGATEWSHEPEDMVLAAKEAAALGHIELQPVSGNLHFMFGYMMRITDAGYDHIKAHDAIGEAEQEVAR